MLNGIAGDLIASHFTNAMSWSAEIATTVAGSSRLCLSSAGSTIFSSATPNSSCCTTCRFVSTYPEWTTNPDPVAVRTNSPSFRTSLVGRPFRSFSGRYRGMYNQPRILSDNEVVPGFVSSAYSLANFINTVGGTISLRAAASLITRPIF